MKSKHEASVRVCEICMSSSISILHRQYFLFPGLTERVHYDVVVCQECGFSYASAIPDQSAWNQFYQTSEHHLHTDLPAGLARIHSDFFQFVQKHAYLARDARVLDVGAGMGHFLNQFKIAGFTELQGLEPSFAAAQLARQVYGLNIQSTSVGSFSQSESFDFISLCGVLEHIVDLRQSMGNIAALLEDDGYLFIAVPDTNMFGSKIPAEPFLEFALEHINFFSIASLDNLLSIYGFESLAVISQHNEFYDNYYLLALYRKISPSSTSLVKDNAASLALQSYVELSRQALICVDSVVDQLVITQEPLLLWGAGALTSRLLCDTRLPEANICAVIDRNKALQGKYLLDLKVVDPDGIIAFQGATVLISSTTYAAEIRDILLQDYAWTGKIISLD